MNQITENLLKTFKPRLAIIVYTPEADTWRETYLESHEIDAAGQLLEGKPLKQETMDGIVDVFFDERKQRVQFGGLIPENMLRFELMPGGKYNMIWYRPAEKRQIYFSEALHIPSGKAWVPSLIYKVDAGDLYVYALTRETGRPTQKEKLYQSPFHNVSDNGSVCLGSARIKKPVENTYTSIIKYWEDLFWLSEFTHLAGQKNPTKTNLNNIWKKLVGKNTKWKALNELQPIKNKTLKNIL